MAGYASPVALPVELLGAYLRRLGIEERPAPTLAWMKRIHRSHVERVPYENIDVQLGRPLTTSPIAAAEKLVGGARGGWCFEMNGVLGAALVALGFQVTRMAGGVRRRDFGDGQIGNHLVLKVDLGTPYLCDVGFGNGLLEPIPLQEGAGHQDGFPFRLERLGPAEWRFHGDPRTAASDFDFYDRPADEGLLEEKCHYLQTSPESIFVQNAVVQIYGRGAHHALRGRVFQTTDAKGIRKQEIADEVAYRQVLNDVFGIAEVVTPLLWSKILARHEVVFGPRP